MTVNSPFEYPRITLVRVDEQISVMHEYGLYVP